MQVSDDRLLVTSERRELLSNALASQLMFHLLSFS
jgi:hypothetical protein